MAVAARRTVAAPRFIDARSRGKRDASGPLTPRRETLLQWRSPRR
jgi:hypothetical protein